MSGAAERARKNLVAWQQRKPANNTGLQTDIKIVSGRIHPALANAVARYLRVDHFSAKIEDFSNGETSVTITESVREADVFIIQPTAVDPNNALMELLALADAARRASARRVTACIPCFGYARSDKQEKTRTPVSAKLVARMLEAAGCSRVLTMDLHSNQIQGFFNIPVDNILMEPFMVDHIKKNVPGSKAVVSPGVSCVHLAKRVADGVGCNLAIIHFGQLNPGITKDAAVLSSSRAASMKLVGDVRGKVAVLLEDLADSCTTLVEMAHYLLLQGAVRVQAVTTHGILSGDAVQQIDRSPLTEFVVTDSVPLGEKHAASSKLHVISIAPLLAESIRRIHNGESISSLYAPADTEEMNALVVDDDPYFAPPHSFGGGTGSNPTTPPSADAPAEAAAVLPSSSSSTPSVGKSPAAAAAASGSSPAAAAAASAAGSSPRPASPGIGGLPRHQVLTSPIRSMSMLDTRTLHLALEQSGLSSPLHLGRAPALSESRAEQLRDTMARRAAAFGTPPTDREPRGRRNVSPQQLPLLSVQTAPGDSDPSGAAAADAIYASMYGSSPSAFGSSPTTFAANMLNAYPEIKAQPASVVVARQQTPPPPDPEPRLRVPGLMKLLDSSRDIRDETDSLHS